MTDNSVSEFYSEEDLATLQAMDAITVELNKKSALPGEPTDSLRTIIGRFRERSLIDLMSMFGTRQHFQKFSRNDTIDFIAAALCDPDNLVGLLMAMPTEARLWLERGIAGELPDDTPMPNDIAEGLQGMGLIAMFSTAGHLHYVVPKEIALAYKTAITPELAARLERDDQISDLLVAAVNLYGVIHYDDMETLIDEYMGTEIDDGDFYELVQKGSKLDEGYFMTKDDLIVCSSLEEWSDAEIHGLALEAGSRARYKPSKEALLKHMTWTYFEPTDEADSLEMLLNVTFPRSPKIGDSALLTIQDLVQQGADLEEIEDVLEVEFELYLRDDPVKYRQVINGIIEVANSTRLWSLNGYTREEMKQLGLH